LGPTLDAANEKLGQLSPYVLRQMLVSTDNGDEMIPRNPRDGFRIARLEFFQDILVLNKGVFGNCRKKCFFLLEKTDALEADEAVEFMQAPHHRFVGVNREDFHVKKVVLLDDLKIVLPFEPMAHFFIDGLQMVEVELVDVNPRNFL
jgi:hypothetical protein